MVAKIYLDTSILLSWILIEEEPQKIKKLPPKSTTCKKLLDTLVKGDFKCRFHTSDWALSEMIQYFKDKAIFKKFTLDGFSISAFNRLKSQYAINKNEMNIIKNAINDFEKDLLSKLDIEIHPTIIDWRGIHHYCLKYNLDTPDAIHLHNAIRNSSDYLTTIDIGFKNSKVKETKIVNPAHLTTIKSLRFN